MSQLSALIASPQRRLLAWLADGFERTVILSLMALFLARFVAAPSHHFHDILLVAAELMVGVFVLIRRHGPPVFDLTAWLAALVGAAAPLMVVPGGTPLLPAAIGSALMTTGFFVNLSAKLFLRRSFGIVAANRGVKTEGPMKPDIDTSNQRPAEFVFSTHVEKKLAEIKAQKKPKPVPAQAAE